jgi:hypothetical protein
MGSENHYTLQHSDPRPAAAETAEPRGSDHETTMKQIVLVKSLTEWSLNANDQ